MLVSSIELQKSELTYSNMQIIAREVELEMMRRSTPKQSEMTSKQKTDKLKKQILGSSNKPNHLQKLISKPINKSKIKDVVSKLAISYFLCFQLCILTLSL